VITYVVDELIVEDPDRRRGL